MDKLIHLSRVIKQVWTELELDPRKELIPRFNSLMSTPLVKFDTAYGTFITGVGSTTQSFDLWLNVQMRVRTELGEHQEAWKQLAALFKETMETTEGGETCDVTDENDFKRYSFLTALAFRIYLDQLFFLPEGSDR